MSGQLGAAFLLRDPHVSAKSLARAKGFRNREEAREL